MAATGGTPKLIALDAWRPLCSPDGKRIAFFGSEDVNKPEPLGDLWRQNPQGAALCVVNRDGSGRKALMRQQWTYPFLIWKPNSQALFSAQVLQQGAKSTITIREFEAETGKVNPLLDIDSEDAKALPRPLNLLSPFIPSGFSNDGRYLFAKLMQFGDADPATFILDRHDFLLAINTQTGQVSEIARFKNVWGYDWHDESSVTPTTTSTPKAPSESKSAN